MTRALAVAREAAALRVTPELRDDVVFLPGRPDFVTRPDLSVRRDDPAAPDLWATDADSGLAAETPISPDGEGDPLTIILHKAGAPESGRVLTADSMPASAVRALTFSRGGRRLLAAGPRGSGAVLDTASGGVVTSWPESPSAATAPVFRGKAGDAVLLRGEDGGLISPSRAGR